MNKKYRRHPELKKLGEKWRKPKTRTNKIRRKLKGKKPMPLIGSGSPKKERNRHPSGLFEIRVSNPKELDEVDKKTECVRISGSVGNKKKIIITKEANKMGIKVLNPKLRVVNK